MSEDKFPQPPAGGPVESRRARIIRESNEMGKLEERTNPYGEAGNKIDATAGASHPFFVMLMMLHMALALQFFFAIVTPIMVAITDERAIIVADDDDDNTSMANALAANNSNKAKSNMNMAMFAFNMLIGVSVFMLWHKARIEEVLFLEKAGRMGNKQPPSETLAYLPLATLFTIVIQLMVVIVDLQRLTPLNGGWWFLATLTVAVLVLLAIALVFRTKTSYTIS